MQLPVWTKPALNGVAIGAIATIIIGFTWGGWVTGGSALSMKETAAREAGAKVIADLCVTKFAAAPDAKAKWAELKEESSWKRSDFIEKGGWATIAGVEAVKGGAEACASQLIAMDELPTPVVQPMTTSSPTEG